MSESHSSSAPSAATPRPVQAEAIMAPSAATSGGKKYVILFVCKHVTFWLPELDSLLVMNGLNPSDVYDRETAFEATAACGDYETSAAAAAAATAAASAAPPPAPPAALTSTTTTPSSTTSTSNTGNTSAQQCGGTESAEQADEVMTEVDETAMRLSPFLRVTLPSDEVAARLASRAFLWKGIYEIWGTGGSYEEVLHSLHTHSEISSDLQRHWLSKSVSWCIQVGGFGMKYSSSKQETLRKKLITWVPFQGPVVLPKRRKGKWIRRPDATFWLLEDFGLTRRNISRPSEPQGIWFVREIAEGNRRMIEKYLLNNRAYLGPTSMDTELSFIMANQGLVKPGTLVLDPFVGTGSLLIACSLLGGTCVGADIDWRILHGIVKGKSKKGRNVFASFKQYGLPLPEIVRLDVSQLHAPANVGGISNTRYVPHGFYDAIVCDPPYGIRAGARKTGATREVAEIPAHLHASHIPATQPYDCVDVVCDLLDTAARVLRMGGRLVYLVATDNNAGFDEEQDLPLHPCLEFVAHSEQPLTCEVSRRLVTMAKISEYDTTRVEEYRAVTRASAQGIKPDQSMAASGMNMNNTTNTGGGDGEPSCTAAAAAAAASSSSGSSSSSAAAVSNNNKGRAWDPTRAARAKTIRQERALRRKKKKEERLQAGVSVLGKSVGCMPVRKKKKKEG